MRRGSLLIIVAGICALLLTLTTAFLMRMRADAREVQMVLRDAQARIMLMAACTYIQEASRIGYDVPSALDSLHEEAYGWIDVRDGKTGPKLNGDGVDDDSRFPIGSAARFPMYMVRRPPYAISLQASYNPIENERPYLRYPDPQPKVDNGWQSGSVSAANWNAFEQGDLTPRIESLNLSWFRIYREEAARFVVTAGAGATQGFRDWDEVEDAGAEDIFSNDAAYFAQLVVEEARLWYLVEWSDAATDLAYHALDHHVMRETEHNFMWPLNESQKEDKQSQMHDFSARGGSIKWVQRLMDPPSRW